MQCKYTDLTTIFLPPFFHFSNIFVTPLYYFLAAVLVDIICHFPSWKVQAGPRKGDHNRQDVKLNTQPVTEPLKTKLCINKNH